MTPKPSTNMVAVSSSPVHPGCLLDCVWKGLSWTCGGTAQFPGTIILGGVTKVTYSWAFRKTPIEWINNVLPEILKHQNGHIMYFWKFNFVKNINFFSWTHINGIGNHCPTLPHQRQSYGQLKIQLSTWKIDLPLIVIWGGCLIIGFPSFVRSHACLTYSQPQVRCANAMVLCSIICNLQR